MKKQIILMGHLNWEEFRDSIVKELSNAKTEKDFLEIINALLFSVSLSEEEMQKKRRRLGIPET